jgi:ATP adenylyltransferase
MTLPKQSTCSVPPGGLWPALLERYRHASSVRALLPIETQQATVEDAGIRFVVRRSSSLARKHAARHEANRSGTARNPFLPYDPDLLVAALPPDHVALLNKYPVIPHHLLIVTRRFEDQEDLLTPRDFAALAACMVQIDGLAFYNGGAAAGASQPHKHLQIVPLPLAADGAGVPIEPLLAAAPAGAHLGGVPGLPFVHGFMRLEPAIFADPDSAAEMLVAHYRTLCTAAGIEGRIEHGAIRQSAPYNLLLTREWMLLVARTRDRVQGISVNALGFAGSLFVRDDAQMRVVLERGPMALLRAVALPARTGNGLDG